MYGKKIRIGVMAPAARIDQVVVDRVVALAFSTYPDRLADIYFHPQCFTSSGHFAGDDASRAAAFLDIANDASFDALWFARGGYGSCRLVGTIMPHLTKTAGNKTYLGYSDAGSLLAALYKRRFAGLAHGPMPADILRPGGEAAVARALAYLIDRAPETLEAGVSAEAPTAAFNLTILSQLLGTPLQPDLRGHVLMIEEEGEYHYRIDRSLFHVTSNRGIRRVAGIKLGRCGNIPANDRDFGATEEQMTQDWCARNGIAYMGRADIGHDIENKIVPFGRLHPV